MSGIPRWAAETGGIVVGPLIARYIAAQRERLAPLGRPLTEESKLRLRQHFSDEDLDRTRIVLADPLPIPNPPLYPLLRWLKLDLPEPALTEAISLTDLIVSREAMGLPLLFHELVHVVQYRQLGLEEFARLYVRGFLVGGGYHGIPLERCAYVLEQRFIVEKEPFDVDIEVGKWISGDLF